jgi:hypothetical protein
MTPNCSASPELALLPVGPGRRVGQRLARFEQSRNRRFQPRGQVPLDELGGEPLPFKRCG